MIIENSLPKVCLLDQKISFNYKALGLYHKDMGVT